MAARKPRQDRLGVPDEEALRELAEYEAATETRRGDEKVWWTDGDGVIHFDVSRVPSRPTTIQRRIEDGDQPQPDVAPGSFEARVLARRVDLVRVVEEGLPPIEYLPASDGMLVRGRRHLIAAPAKEGKSISMEVHWVDMAIAGAVVVVLDRENGQEIYARRLDDLFRARNFNKRQWEKVRAGLRYYEFPQLRRDDAENLVESFREADLVVFDAQRMFLSDFEYSESDSDDYAKFMSYAIDPLFRARIATCILDNTGHGDKRRSRGTSAKGDLNEVVFTLKGEAPFDLYRRGRVKLTVNFSRLGNTGDWIMDLGGGHFGPWRPITEVRDRPDFLAEVEKLVGYKPQGADKLIEGARQAGVHIGQKEARELLRQYAAAPDVPITAADDGYRRSE